MNVLLDANIIIDLIKLNCFQSVIESSQYDFFITDNVLEEIKYAEQKELLQELIDSKYIEVISLTNFDELKLFGELCDYLGIGEASCLAAAKYRGWIIASDEKKRFWKEANKRLGKNKIVRTPQLITQAVKVFSIDLEKIKSTLTQTPYNITSRRENLEREHLFNLIDEAERFLQERR